jgi:hypothetical protein
MNTKPIPQEPGSLAVLIRHAVKPEPGEIAASKHFDTYLATLWVLGRAWQTELLMRPGHIPTHSDIVHDFTLTQPLWQELTAAQAATS